MQALKNKIQANTLNAKQAAISIVLVTNAFVWYYFIIMILQGVEKNFSMDESTTLLMWILHFSGIIFSALVGATLVKKIKNRNRFLLLWMLTGVLLSGIAVLVSLAYVPTVLLLSLLFGVSLGIGMPTCMDYFSETVAIEKRGLVAGIIFFLSGTIIASLGMISDGNTSLQTIILSGWRLLGVLAFVAALVSSSVKTHQISRVS